MTGTPALPPVPSPATPPVSPGGPIWKGTTPAYKDANSFKQWFNDDAR